MDSRQLLYFKTVCDEGSFTRAAEKLYISPQGINKAIKKLEEELGVPLFETTTLGIRLTSFGMALQSHAADYIANHNYILDKIAAMRDRLDYSLVIGLQSGSSTQMPEGFFPDFIEANPDITVSIRSYHQGNMKEAMENTDIKVWFCSGPFDTESYEVLYERHHKLFLIAAENHPIVSRKNVKMSDLQNLPLIEIAYNLGHKDQLIQNLAHTGISPQYLMDTPDRRLTMDLVQRGLAVSFHGGNYYKAFPGIVPVEIEDMDIQFSTGIVIRKEAYRTTAIERFVDYIEERLKKREPTEG